jgi:glucokinase
MILAIDAGGTYLRAQLHVNDAVTHRMKELSNAMGLKAWIESILKKYSEITTVCVSYAGQVSDGVILDAPNLHVDCYEIQKYFQERFGVAFFIQNDLNCAVVAEANYFESKNVCAIYVGTGIGLGVVSDGRLLCGSSGVATELGHIPYKEASYVCGCGKSNCLELFASGSALHHYKKEMGLDDTVTLQQLQASGGHLYKEFENALVYGVATAVTLCNPEVLVLGGGIITSTPDLVDTIREKLSDYAMPVALKHLKIERSKLEDAPLLGALLLKDSQ